MTKNEIKDDELRSTVIRSLDKGVRFDGREDNEEYRPIELSSNMSCKAEGSARVQIGGTVVLVGIKMGIEMPYPDRPEHGKLMVNTELLPLSNPDFEKGPPSIQAIELSRVVDRGVRESDVIQIEKLCIKPGEKVWSVMIDICTLNDEGNLFDAAALGALVALKTCKFPKYDEKEGKVDYKEHTDPLPLNEMPVAVTVLKIGTHYLVDPCYAEWQTYDSRLTVATLKDGTICAMQKGGDYPLSLEDIDKMVSLGMKKAKELRKQVDKIKK